MLSRLTLQVLKKLIVSRSLREYLKKKVHQYRDAKDFQTLKKIKTQDEDSLVEKQIKGYFVHKIHFLSLNDRINLFNHYCKGKKVLHVGCTDYPIFDPNRNLHITLSKITSQIHGLDSDVEGLKILKTYVNQPYFSSAREVTDSYDVCLVPEVIEHVSDINLFLKEIEKIEASLFIFTAPNAFSELYSWNKMSCSKNQYIESVHPDHNCWFSPFTLQNCIKKYTSLKINAIFLIIQKAMVCCVCSKK